MGNFNEAEFCANRTIAVCALTGSHNYNLNTPASDEDYKYFVYPNFNDLYAGKMFANSMTSTNLDATCHDVRQLVDLVWKANLNFIEVLFSENVVCDDAVRPIFDARDSLATMNLYAFFKATYGMHLMKIKDLRKGTGNTTMLVEKFGYDTKQACHALRCLYVISRFMESGYMGKALWFEYGNPQRNVLLDVKAGKYTEAQFLDFVASWHNVWKDEAEKFYRATVPDNVAHDWAQDKLKQIVKNNLIK
jgi:predicted nucleotidyltransferase